MIKSGSFLHSRSLWIYYALFFSGSLVLVYEVFKWNLVGDSVNFLCLLFLINGFLAKKPLHILENSFLMTLGYILPLLIRNSLKLTYIEAPSLKDFMHLALTSSGMTLVFGVAFSCLGYVLAQGGQKILQMSRSKITTTNTLNDD